MKRLPLAILAVLATLVVTAVLGAGLAAGSSAANGTTVKVTKSHLGKIIVDGRGRTLYLFEKDKRGSGHSSCSGACAAYWPPLLTAGKPVAGTGAKKALLRTIKRSDGKKQVTYNGHPLYRFVQDAKAGQTKGQDTHFFGGGWYVVSPSGKKVGD